MGKHLPGNRVLRQSIGNPIFPNKNDSYSTLERSRLRDKIQFRNFPRCWFYEHSGRFFIQNRSRPKEKLELTIRNDVHTKAIQVNIQSSGIVEEEQIYILPANEIDENKLWEEKQNVRNQAQTETHNDPENAVSELQHFHKPTSGLISVSPGYFTNNARICLNKIRTLFLETSERKKKANPLTKTIWHLIIDTTITYKIQQG